MCSYSSPPDAIFSRWGCSETALPGRTRCIFHDPTLTKDTDALLSRLRVRLADESEDPIRLDGAIFPEMYFEDIVFPRSVSFFEAQFVGKKTNCEIGRAHV